MNCERWQAMLRGLGVPPERDTYSRLESAYAQKHRAYHTPRHIDECLSLLDEFNHLAAYPAEVECALWFHDAIYEPMSNSNEERSANWAAEFGSRASSACRMVFRWLSRTQMTKGKSNRLR